MPLPGQHAAAAPLQLSQHGDHATYMQRAMSADTQGSVPTWTTRRYVDAAACKQPSRHSMSSSLASLAEPAHQAWAVGQGQAIAMRCHYSVASAARHAGTLVVNLCRSSATLLLSLTEWIISRGHPVRRGQPTRCGPCHHSLQWMVLLQDACACFRAACMQPRGPSMQGARPTGHTRAVLTWLNVADQVP